MAPRFVSRARALTALLVAGTLTTCARDAAGPGRRVALAVEAVLPSSLELDAFNLTIDNIRLIVVRPPSDTVFNSTFPFLPNLDSLQLSAEVTLEQSPETFQVTIQMLSGSTLLFTGTQDVTVSSVSNNPPAQVPVTYSGPGQNVATLTIGPQDSVLTQGASLQFRVSAFDAQSNPVTTFYLSWSTSDPVAVPIDATGRIVAPLTRSTVNISARTPNNVNATTPITFAPAATALSIVSGCGQSGPVLTQLPQPIVAKVIAGDGLGVEGVVVTFIAPAGASVATAQVVTDAAGLAQTLVTLGSTSGAVVFQVSAPGLGTVPCSQSAFGTATQLAFITQPSNTSAGSVITPALVVTVLDAQGIPVPTFTGNATIALGSNPGNATLSGTTTVPFVGGSATFSDLSLDSVGTGYTLQASAAGLTGTTSAAFNVVSGVATQLAFIVHPSTTQAGSPITPAVVVLAQDALGNTVLTFTGNVTITINSGPPGAALTGTATVGASAGVATFANLVLDSLGTYTLQASASGTSSATSLPFDVVAGAATHLEVIVTPATVQAGDSLSILVTARDLSGAVDPNYLGTIRFTATDNQATLPQDYTFTAGDAGVHAFPNSATLQTVGTHLVIATDVDIAQITGSQLVTVSAGVADHLAFIQQPSTVTQGLTMTPAVVVVVQDSFNNVVATSTDLITLSIQNNPGQANLGGTTSQNATAGFAVFSDLSLDSPGSGYTLGASVSGLPLLVSNPFDVLPTGAVKIWIGEVSADWSDPANWNPSGVPGPTDNVQIAPAANDAVLSTNVSVRDLTVDISASVNTNGFALTASGNVDATGIIFGSGTVALSGTGTTVRGNLPSILVTGVVTVVDHISATGNLSVLGSGSFDLATSSFVSVTGSFSTSGTATITMTAGGVLIVDGNVDFGGGSESGKLTNGTIEVLGNFSQSGNPESFATSGFLLTAFLGTGAQTVQFANPGRSAGSSQFTDFYVYNTGSGVSLASEVFALGNFSASTGQGAINRIFGNGHTLTTKGLFVDSLTIDNMPLVVDSSTTHFIGFFDNVVFQNFLPTAIQMDVTRTNGTYTFNNLQFLGTPPSPGFHLRANDPVVGDGRFTINMVNPTPTATGARFTTTGEPALINWP
ncbi:MAG TPA: hypothetical protein VH833_00745 [Gemmatimonadales bacterium]